MVKNEKKYYLLILGCQMNYADGEKIDAVMAKIGVQKTAHESEADLIMVVACSVRQAAVDRIYGKARNWQSRRRQGKLFTILTGCVLPTDQKKLKDKFDLILPISEINQLPKKLGGLKMIEVADYFHLKPDYNSKFQAQVPVMTGCNNYCSYCVVPYVRGREVSRPAGEIIKECQDLIVAGYKEITLLGQNVNSYKSKSKFKIQNSKFSSQNSKTIDFPLLLKTIDETPGDYWLRFVTSHPKDLSDNLIKVMKSGRHLTPYLHLPIQSGDARILKAMNRNYTPVGYINLVKKIRKAVPEIMISTDIIVGFPGETKKEFLNTVKIFKQVKFDMAYLAQYSPRVGTAAAKLADDVPKAEKKRRWEVLNNILKKTALENNKRLIGQEILVLAENFSTRDGGRVTGKSDSFRTVIFPGCKDLIGQFVKVKIEKVDSWGLYGKIV